jgi:acyl-CoA thioester hydrolase
MMDCTERLVSRSPVIVRRRVAWGDCDPAGVVYTPRFSDYAVSARNWFMRACLEHEGSADGPHGLSFPLRTLSFDFKSFLIPHDVFDMLVLVTNISRRTFTLEIATTHESGRELFSANATQMCLNPNTREAVSLPDVFRAALERYRADHDRARLKQGSAPGPIGEESR